MDTPILANINSWVDISNIYWNRFCTYEAFYDMDQNVMLQVSIHGKPVMAFRFNDLSPSAFASLRSRWAQCYLSVYGLGARPKYARYAVKERTDWHNAIPITTVIELPTLDMWNTQTKWFEDAFWASPDMRLRIVPGGVEGSCIELVTPDEQTAGWFRFSSLTSEDPTVHELAFGLQDSLHLSRPIRVESYPYA